MLTSAGCGVWRDGMEEPPDAWRQSGDAPPAPAVERLNGDPGTGAPCLGRTGEKPAAGRGAALLGDSDSDSDSGGTGGTDGLARRGGSGGGVSGRALSPAGSASRSIVILTSSTLPSSRSTPARESSREEARSEMASSGALLRRQNRCSARAGAQRAGASGQGSAERHHLNGRRHQGSRCEH